MADGDIRGTVSDKAGVPVEGVTVSLFEHNGSLVVHTTTDENGEYVFDGTNVQGTGPWHVSALYQDVGGQYNFESKPDVTATLEVPQTTYTTDSFENYNDGDLLADPYENPNNNMEADSDRSFDGNIAVLLTANGSSGYGGGKPTPDAVPDSVSFVYQEGSTSQDFAWELQNENGNFIGAVGSNNPQVMVQDANGSTEVVASPSPNYAEWRRFTITFDWANDQFDVLWEDLTGTTADSDTGPYDMGNASNGISEWLISPQDWSTGADGTNSAVWLDEVWGIEE